MALPKGYIFSKESRNKMSLASKGRPKSIAHRESLSVAQKRNPRRYWLGKKMPEEMIEKMRQSHLGKKQTAESRLKKSLALRGNKGYWWKGGVTPKNERIRKSAEYKLWREAVFSRDNYTCVFCKTKGVYLHADHVKPFAYFPELRFVINNGRTLCVPCHRATETYGK